MGANLIDAGGLWIEITSVRKDFLTNAGETSDCPKTH